jgi:hypothetical protein
LRKVVVEIERFCLNRRVVIPNYLAAKTNISAFLSPVADQTELHFSAYIAAQKVKKREVRYPKTWWDAFKRAYFPNWLLKHMPVTMTLVTLDAKLIYPDLYLEEHNRHMIILKSEPKDYLYPEEEQLWKN